MRLVFKVKILLLVGVLFIFNSCKENDSKDEYEVFTGTLVNSLFKLGSFYEMPDSIVKKMEYILDSLSKDIREETVEFIESYNVLKNNSLLYSPFIELELDSNEFYNVYLAEEEYNKVKPYLGFNKGRRKNIIIKLKGTKLNHQLIDCTQSNIISIEQLD